METANRLKFPSSLRNNGFSKDGKDANPQVEPGLPVSRDGYPLSYALFNGASFTRTLYTTEEERGLAYLIETD